MVKSFNICKICGKRRYLNYAELCKKCNNTVLGLEIAEIAIEKKHEMQAEMEIHQSEELKEKQALEEMDELTSKQKERLVELSPDINTIAELDKQVEKTDEETKEEKPNEK
jgi:myo-inositol-1-phosphate synthase